MHSIFKIQVYFTLVKLSTLFSDSDAFWGGGGGFGGGFGRQHGYGYGQGVCAGARQRQGIMGGGGFHQQQPVSPYSYYNSNNDDYSGYYYQDPSPVMRQPLRNVLATPIQNGDLGFRIKVAPTQAPIPQTCSQPSKRDATVFDQKCIFPQDTVQNLCSSRGDTLPTGTTSFTTCKAPQYFSDTGDMILEICKDGKWNGDGKTLTCKSNAIVTQPPVVNTPPYRQDNVAQYVQQPQIVEQPVVPPSNPNPLNPLPAQNYYNPQYTQQPQQWNQPVSPPAFQSGYQSNVPVPVVKDADTQTPQVSYWDYYQPNRTVGGMPSQQQYIVPSPAFYPPPTTPTTTTTSTTTEATTTSTTTTTPRPYMIDEIDWRKYANPNIPDVNPPYYPPSFYYRPEQQRNSQSNTEKCPPLPSRNGVILECLSKSAKGSGEGSGYIVSISDCQEPQPVGTEATYKCQMYYEPLSGMATQYRKCKENGIWTGSDDGFGCKLECGKSNPGGRLPLITFGETTVLGQWPWHAGIFVRDRGDLSNACGGTLISKKAVLTAAHCVTLHYSSLTRELNDIRVDLGRYNREKDDPYVQKIQVEKLITHPAYNPFMFESDIAIVILKEEARIGFHVRPSCFPKTQNAAFDEMQLTDGSYATVVGWGVNEEGKSPDELHSAKIKVIGYRECIESFEDVEFASQVAKSTTFCAGNGNEQNVCHGDSGGGAFFAAKVDGLTRWYLQGIVSIGINYKGQDKKCDPTKVSIFTRVGPYADWINRVLSEHDAI